MQNAEFRKRYAFDYNYCSIKITSSIILSLQKTLNDRTYLLLFNYNSVADPSIPNSELRNYELKLRGDQISGISIVTSLPKSDERAIPSMIA